MSSPKANLEVLPRSIRFVLALSAVALLAFPFVGSDFYTQMVTRMMILGIFAMSLDLLQGVTGLVSLGHAAYFGLAGYAFTRSLKHAHLLAHELQVGMLYINQPATPSAEMPFGGVKDSGYGTEGGPEALDAYLNTRAVTVMNV